MRSLSAHSPLFLPKARNVPNGSVRSETGDDKGEDDNKRPPLPDASWRYTQEADQLNTFSGRPDKGWLKSIPLICPACALNQQSNGSCDKAQLANACAGLSASMRTI